MGAGELARAPLQSCFYQLFWLFPILKHKGEKRRCAHKIALPKIPLAPHKRDVVD